MLNAVYCTNISRYNEIKIYRHFWFRYIDTNRNIDILPTRIDKPRDCAICLSDQGTALTECNHLFHYACIRHLHGR